MNAVSTEPQAASEALGTAVSRADAMVALPVTRDAFARYCREVESFQAARARSRGLLATVFGGLLGVSLAANAIAHLLPLQKLVPVFLWVRPDGAVDSQENLSELPSTAEAAVIRSELWTYVRLRQGYSKDTAHYGYDVVSAMSAPQVRQAYQRWFNAPNPDSPQVVLAGRGSVSVRYVSGAYIAPQVYQITYEQTVQLDAGPAQTTRWVVPVSFTKVTALPASARLENPGGIVVTDYPPPEQVAPQ
jgi:type IV secretion system protein VirB8